MGTKINNTKKKTKIGITNLFNNDVSIADITNIIIRDRMVNARCFEKKK